MTRDELLTQLAMKLSEWPEMALDRESLLVGTGWNWVDTAFYAYALSACGKYQVTRDHWVDRRTELISEPDDERYPAPESSGGDNDYWIAIIARPKRLEPYQAECEDLIEHFRMTFQEGEAFKALWRKGQLRIGNGKPGDTHLRNAEKVRHFGQRMEVMELANADA